jgi:hypothetical protein
VVVVRGPLAQWAHKVFKVYKVFPAHKAPKVLLGSMALMDCQVKTVRMDYQVHRVKVAQWVLQAHKAHRVCQVLMVQQEQMARRVYRAYRVLLVIMEKMAPQVFRECKGYKAQQVHKVYREYQGIVLNVLVETKL